MKNKVLFIAFAIQLLFSISFATANGTQEKQTKKVDSKDLTVLGTWLSSEGEAFEYVLQGFTEKTGIKVTYEGVNDPTTVLGTRIAAGDLPDIVMLGGGEGFLDLIAQGVPVSLNPIRNTIEENFYSSWYQPYTFKGNIYAIPTRCNVQNLLWFNPKKVDKNRLTTLKGFYSVMNEDSAKGNYPFSCFYKLNWGVSMLFDACMSVCASNEEFTRFQNKQMPYNDPVVVKTCKMMCDIVNDKYVKNGVAGALGTDLVDSMAQVFGTGSSALFTQAGSWAGGIISGAVNKDIVGGETMDYVLFPGYKSILSNADIAVELVDSTSGMKLMEYLASAEGLSRFAKYNYVVANKNVDPSLYQGALEKEAMQLLKQSCVVPAAMNPAEINSAAYQMEQMVLVSPDKIKSILDDFEHTYGPQLGR